MNNIKRVYLNTVTVSDLSVIKWILFLSIFTFLAVLLPYACHQFSIAGMVFLPMHFAVLIAAIVMGYRGGITVALISPVLSYVTSSMPPLISLMPITIELITYATIMNICLRKFKIPLIFSLLIAMLMGRVVSIVFVSFILQNTLFMDHLHNLFIVSIPGIIIQLIFVPLVSSKIIRFLKES